MGAVGLFTLVAKHAALLACGDGSRHASDDRRSADGARRCPRAATRAASDVL
ncbi:hypothetical protein PT2222_10494 [Paraburkholderia tropica]